MISIKTSCILLFVLGCIQGSVANDTELETGVRKFLDRAERALHSENKDVVSGLFTSTFVFTKCQGSVNASEFVNALSNLHPATEYSFELKSANVVNGDIEFVATIKDLGKAVMTIQATLEKSTQRLKKAKKLGCDNRVASGKA